MENESREPEKRRFLREAAQKAIALRSDPAILSRMAALATKGNAGQLTDEERAEYESLIQASGVIGILQARARSILDENS